MLIQPGRLVFADSRWEDLGFPRARRRFEALELRQDRANGIGPFHAALGRDALPFKEEPQEVSRRNGFDLCTQALDGVTVDARQ